MNLLAFKESVGNLNVVIKWFDSKSSLPKPTTLPLWETSVFLAPLLLTWINLNPSIDK